MIFMYNVPAGFSPGMSQKQGCRVEIKHLTKEVSNYQLIGIASKLTVYCEILCESLYALEKKISGGLKWKKFG